MLFRSAFETGLIRQEEDEDLDVDEALLDAALTRVDDWYKLAEVPQH